MENDKLNNIKEKILELRQNLLDTTRRNKLLNFKPLRRSIKIIDENILELFNIFVVEEDYMEFSPIPKSDEKKLAIGTDNLWKMPVSRKQIPDRHVDRFLQTNLDEETLQKRLFRLFQMYKTNLSEQGFNDFFLALGFLEWNEIEHSEIIYKSPLILIPVKIYRESVQDPFKIAWDKEDIQLNISLESKLKEQDVVLPNVELNSKENVNNYFNEIEFIIKEKGWKINNDIYLNDFNFKKFIMYKDLESENWKSLENNEISQVFFPTERDHEYFDEENVDTLDIHNVFNVVDADSSQIAVIEEVKKGQSLVVEGPPGTGKSQTIVNLIAELMANKKTILFVSEKMAALEVVKSRLESIDLGEGCLELHSNKSNKREVLADLENTLNRAQYGLNDISETFQDLNRTKKLLNSYLKILTQEYGSTGYSAYDLIGIMDFNARVIEKYSNNEPFTVNLSNLDYLDSSKRGKLLGDISQIKDYYNDVKPVLRNPWKSTNFNELTRNDMEKIQNKSLNHILNEINELNNTINKIVEISKTERLDSFNKLNEYCDNLPLLKENPKLINDDLDSLIENIKAYQNGIVDISDETIFNNDLKLFKSNLDVLKDDAKK
ncbi:MAG: DUF4011 domain-containing protein, partial [Methanobrevibacter sp.]|nr:DUF4011 domain-containing protein [Candidatus Methanoflexus mossambicus]